MKSKLILSILLMASSLVAFEAFAGTNSGGGGQGVICRDLNGQVQSAEILDLYELENYYVRKLQPGVSGTYLQIAKRYANVLGNAMTFSSPMMSFGNSSDPTSPDLHDISPAIYIDHRNATLLADDLVRMNREKVLVPGDNKLPAAGDSHPRILPSRRGCEIEQVAFYTDGDERLHILEQIWNKMDARNKGALLVHESLYRMLRSQGDIDSDRARKALGFAFSGLKMPWVMEGAPSTFLSCWTNDPGHENQFIVYLNQNPNFVTAQFVLYDGKPTLDRTVTGFSVEPFAKVFGVPVPNPSPANGVSMINSIENVLLDRTNYYFDYERRADGSMPIHFGLYPVKGAVDNANDRVNCQPGLSIVTIEPNGTISVGQAPHN